MAHLKRFITNDEYILLVVAASEKRSRGNTPTASDISASEAEVKSRLFRSGISIKDGSSAADRFFTVSKRKIASEKASVSGDEVADRRLIQSLKDWHQGEHSRGSASGSSVGSFWNKVRGAAMNVARRAGPIAMIALPVVAPAAVATPFVLMAIKASQKSHAAKKATATPPETPEAPETSYPTVPTAPMAPNDEESLEIASGSCGAPEAAALKRRGPPFYFPSFFTVGQSIPNEVYRAGVLQLANKIGKGKPSTREFMLAEKFMKNELRKNGVVVSLPGAAPGRRTI